MDLDQSKTGKVCFIAGALPGETVHWRRIKSKRSFEEGELVEVIEPSPDRVVPKCRYISDCGGCELQHLESSAQLAFKESQVKRAFSSARIEPREWLPSISGNPWRYRRRARLAVAFKGNQVLLGYRRRSSRSVVAVDSCVVVDPKLDELIPNLARRLSNLHSTGLSEIELSRGDSAAKTVESGNAEIGICLSVKVAPTETQLQPLLDFCDSRGIQLWYRSGKSLPKSIREYPPLQARLSDELSMNFRPGQFVQVNADINRKMIATALNLLDINSSHRVLDLFCGAGNFSLPLAHKALSLLGIEGLANLVAQADSNSKQLGLDDAEYRVSDLFAANALSGKQFTKSRFDRVLIDPPRTGAKELMDGLVKISPQKMVYVSCHPATMVRDTKILVDGGYQLAKVGVIDMFPQTTHVEAIALLEK